MDLQAMKKVVGRGLILEVDRITAIQACFTIFAKTTILSCYNTLLNNYNVWVSVLIKDKSAVT